MRARGALLEAQANLIAMNNAVAQADAPAAMRRLQAAKDSSASAYRNTRGPVWWVGAHLPILGDDVDAVRTVAGVSRDLSADTLPPLVEAGAKLTGSAVRPADGQISLAPLREVAPTLEEGAGSLGAAARRLNGLDSEGLLGSIRGPVESLQERLGSAHRVVADAAAVTKLLPGMLGAKQGRTYILLIQNNAEIRSLGGFGGSFAVAHARNGRLELERTAKPGDIGDFTGRPVEDVTDEENRIFGDDIVRYSQDTTTTPDFPRAAQLLAHMWESRINQKVDGVVSLDPVALSYVLRATGPITVEGRELTSANVVGTLLNKIYLEEPDENKQEALFSGVSTAVFEKLRTGAFDVPELASALKQGVEQRRLMAWSAVTSEQAELRQHQIGGALPVGDTQRPEIGVYVNDSGTDKLAYYLDYRTDVTADRCNLGAQRLHVRTVLESKVPPGKLTEFVTGPGSDGLPLGDMRITTYTYGPVDGRIDALSIDGVDTPFDAKTHHGRPVGAATVDIPRGSTRVIEYTVYSSRGQSGEARLLTTPGAITDGLGDVGPSACG